MNKGEFLVRTKQWQFNLLVWAALLGLSVVSSAKTLQQIPDDPQARAAVSDALKRPSQNGHLSGDTKFGQVRYALPYARLSNDERVLIDRKAGRR